MKRIVNIEGKEFSNVETVSQFEDLCEAKYLLFKEPVVENLYEILKKNTDKSLFAFCENVVREYIYYKFENKAEERGLTVVSYKMPCYLKNEVEKIKTSLVEEIEAE